MIEPIDDDLREYVRALQAVEQPSPAAQAATWARIEQAMVARPARAGWTIAALAAGVALCVGLAAAAAWRDQRASAMQAIDRPAATAPLRLEERTPTPTLTPIVRPDEPTRPRPTTLEPPRRRPAADAALSLRPEEVASFRRAQAALADGDSEAALRALDEHGRRFPGGFFEEERSLSRAVALCQAGRIAEARAARDRFLKERPGSHLGERMRRICREKD
jgi:hypothetical protein